jgi:hypothetical protein
MMSVHRYRCRFDLSGWTQGFIRGCEDGFECNLWLHERWVSNISTHPLSGAMSPYLIPLRAFKLCGAAKREAAQCTVQRTLHQLPVRPMYVVSRALKPRGKL